MEAGLIDVFISVCAVSAYVCTCLLTRCCHVIFGHAAGNDPTFDLFWGYFGVYAAISSWSSLGPSTSSALKVASCVARLTDLRFIWIHLDSRKDPTLKGQ